ncbi:NtaA/DmoA family FMN-dependent monooxygenase [Cryobacterium arcticum]|uniref:Xenobiotic compound monooxygenase subunit A n=1 Tax=Cryobacterium arcticum TaxID=670052 RepID=A0A1B1BKM5_9MICO|nr:NtaA/DmoA family FMN-dependent monooxygenase [Cryobacterium arcticum]ANP73160.1 xenobiotic compound monooxygenase subunit A [Cryobacterium arcticum]
MKTRTSLNAPEHSDHLVLSAMVRTLGAFPSGWRYPGAHKDPAKDAEALKRVAKAAEKSGFDFLFLGDWLSADIDLEFSDPHLLSRADSLSTASYLAASTRRIGIVGTVNVAHSEPYATARSAASIDRLSHGRFGLNLTVGTDARGAANFGKAGYSPEFDRFEVADEYVQVLRGLWDGWDDSAFVHDTESGALIDRSRVTALDHVGRSYAVAGPLNVQRPVQGHVPLMHAGTSRRALEFAAEFADIYLAASATLDEARNLYAETKLRVGALGRPSESLSIIAPLLPVVGETRAEAYEVYDTLVELFQVDDGSDRAAKLDLPANRSAQSLRQLVGLPLADRSIDDVVTAPTAARFNNTGHRLLDVVADRSGRRVGGDRPVTYRHLLVAHLVRSPLVVGSPADIADHMERWFRAGAVDGFGILSAFLHEQFESFTRLVVPELARRGLVRGNYAASTLRGHLGASLPGRR